MASLQCKLDYLQQFNYIYAINPTCECLHQVKIVKLNQSFEYTNKQFTAKTEDKFIDALQSLATIVFKESS